MNFLIKHAHKGSWYRTARNTSKTCSACGVVNPKLKAEMQWQCPDCGAEHDRDENAALNIALKGQEKMAEMLGKKAKVA